MGQPHSKKALHKRMLFKGMTMVYLVLELVHGIEGSPLVNNYEPKLSKIYGEKLGLLYSKVLVEMFDIVKHRDEIPKVHKVS